MTSDVQNPKLELMKQASVNRPFCWVRIPQGNKSDLNCPQPITLYLIN
jgi:hypothetical protein